MHQFYLHNSKCAWKRRSVCKDVLTPTSHRPFSTMKMTVLQSFPETENYNGGLAGGWLTVGLSTTTQDSSLFAEGS